ncbi:hypothetical protein RUND412_004230 [Rhizina undulata]
MPERRYNPFSSLFFQQMQQQSTSNAANLLSSSDEELVYEADEPPDYLHSATYQSSDNGFSKSVIRYPIPAESLLTRALKTPEFGPVDRLPAHRPPRRGMSTSSNWSTNSGASTVDLTSDGGMTSRNSSPSPPSSLFFGIAGFFQDRKAAFLGGKERKVEIVSDSNDVELTGRKRCITFACQNEPISRRSSTDSNAIVAGSLETLNSEKSESALPKRNCMLKFVCTQREDAEKKLTRRARSPAPKAASNTFDGPLSRRESESTVTSAFTESTPRAIKAHTTPAPISIHKDELPENRFYEFASSVEDKSDAWTKMPIDKSRLLKVDDLLRKELAIRKLSEEAEEEALQEEDTLEADVGENWDEDDEDDEEEDEDDEFEEEEDYDEDDEEGQSGNETDDEEGFASDSDDGSDDLFFGYGPQPPNPSFEYGGPLCCRTASESSMESLLQRHYKSRHPRRPVTPELPDSTDFVCGTLDEDQPLEIAYVSCMEERKRSKHVMTPQDIDPSFPTSDPEDSDKEERRHSGASNNAIQFTKPNCNDSSSDHRKSRALSPAPVRRTKLAHSPAPRQRANSRALSPPPPIRAKHISFQSRPSVLKTKSLPRISGFAHREAMVSRNISTGTPPVVVRPVAIHRTADDIVKGLEKRRERRRARLARVKEENWKAGEGVEKMRELGLEICGKGKGRANTQAQWVLSA